MTPQRPGTSPGRHDVFDSDGFCVGTLQLPAALDAFEIGTDSALGRGRDEPGAQRVQLHRITGR